MNIIILSIFPAKLFPRSVINKWPAIMLAFIRTASDPGRMKFLIDSISTIIKGINGYGVPTGTRWFDILFVFFLFIRTLLEILR
jgi:hypothetical protein